MASVVWIALGTVAAHLATGWRYGFDRDELMALEDARHLAWGYVQYPPMTAFWGRVALELFGTSLVGFRFFAALAMAVAVVLTGLLAKEMGGGKWAQVTAALAAVPFCLGAGSLMQYMSFDYVCWVGVAWCVVRVAAARRENGREKREKRKRRSGGVEEWKSDKVQESEHRNSKMENDAERVGGEKGYQEKREDNAETLRTQRNAEKHETKNAQRNWEMEDLQEVASASSQAWTDGKHGERCWAGVGVGIGLGMMAKYTMGFLVCGVVVGVLLTEMRRYLRSGWLWLGVLLSVVIVLPNFLWEWRRGFVSLEFLRFLHVRDVREGLTDWFLAGQLELTMLAFPLALAGIWFCLFTEEGRRFRILGWMYVVPLVLFLVMRGRDYYLAPGYPMLYAAGAVWVEKKWREKKSEIRNSKMENREENMIGFLASRTPLRTSYVESQDASEKHGSEDPPLQRQEELENKSRWGWMAKMVWAGLILDVVVAGAVALPIAPVNSAWWRFATRVDSVFPEEIGWPEFVQAVAAVRDRLPEEERARVGILAGNYGEVGALNLYGERFGLPRAMSGVNSSWERGYGDPSEVVIVVGYARAMLEPEFASCVVRGRVWNRYGVMNEETIEDPEIFVCRGLKGSWEEFWRKVRKFA
jgi:hypothetical protein